MRIRGVAAVAGIALLAACGSSQGNTGAETPAPTSAPARDVHGTVAVEGNWYENVQQGNTNKGGTCIVEDGFDDQESGAQVVVSDASGETVGLGSLVSRGLQASPGTTDMQETWCGFTFTVKDVPTGSEFYGVAIGNRDPVQFPEDELFGGGLSLTLGDVPGA